MINLFISNTLSLLILTYLGKHFLKLRFKEKYITVFILIFLSFFITLINGINISILSTITITIAFCFYLIVIFVGNFKKYLILFLFFISSHAISEVLSANLMNLIFNLSPNDIYTFKYTFAIIMSSSLSFFMSFLFIKFFKSYHSNQLPNYVCLIFVLPITTMLLILNISDYFDILKSNTILFFILIGLILSNLITIYIFIKFANAAYAENELLKAKKEKELSDIKYNFLNEQFSNNYSFLHNTVTSLMKLVDRDDDTQKIKEKIADVNSRLLYQLNIINSNSSTISPLLNNKSLEIVENEIDFKSVIEYNDFTFIDVYSQRKIFSLLLDIAILQCIKVPKEKRLILLKTKKIGQQLIIQGIFAHADTDNIVDHKLEELESIVKQVKGDFFFKMNLYSSNDSILIYFGNV